MSRLPRLAPLSLMAFVVWLFALAVNFYVVQKPVPIDYPIAFWPDLPPLHFAPAALLRSSLDLLAALWLLLLALGNGLWLLRLLNLNEKRALPQLLFGTGLGLWALSLLVFAFGLLGWLNNGPLWGLTLALSLTALPPLWRLRLRLSKPQPPRWLALYLTLALAMSISLALLPPTDWDGLFYHLTGPKLYLTAGGIVGGIDIPHLSFPALFEMLFLQAMVLRGDVSAKLLHFGFIPLLAGLVYLAAVDTLSLKQGWMAIIFLLAMPMVLTLGAWAYNDLALAFYQTAALYALLRSMPAENAARQLELRWLGLSGLNCGAAMGLKYTSFVAPVVLGLMVWWWLARQRANWPQVWRSSLAFGGPAVLAALPWYLRNWAFTGNPVYPFVFGGPFWDTFRSAAYAGAGTGIGFDGFTLLTLPYHLTMGLPDANYIDGRTGLLWLAFLPLLLFFALPQHRARRPHAFAFWLIFALAQYAYWTVGVIWSAGLWQSRLLLPGLVALVPILAWTWDQLRYLNRPQFSLQRFLSLFVGLVLMLSLLDQAFNNQRGLQNGWFHHRPWRYLMADESREAYLTRRLGQHYTTMQALNQTLPGTARVVFLWEPRSYYCRVDCRPDSILDRYGHLKHLHGQDAAAIAASWRSAGISHILMFEHGLNFLIDAEDIQPELRPDVALLDRLRREHLQALPLPGDAYSLYELR